MPYEITQCYLPPGRMCVVRRSNNSFVDRCFEAAGPHLWNMLPVYLRQCDSLGQFKWLLKTHLFRVWDRSAS